VFEGRAALEIDGIVSEAKVHAAHVRAAHPRDLAGRFLRDVPNNRFAASATMEADLQPLRIRVPSPIVDLPGAGAVRLEGSADVKETRIRCEIPDADEAAILTIVREGSG